MLWTGRILSTLAALFLLLDGIMKFVKPQPVLEATEKLGYPEGVLFGLGLVLTASTVLYLILRTAVLGAVLLTGYLGGAVASHVRIADPTFSMLFPAIFGAILWGRASGSCDRRLRALLPLRR